MKLLALFIAALLTVVKVCIPARPRPHPAGLSARTEHLRTRFPSLLGALHTPAVSRAPAPAPALCLHPQPTWERFHGLVPSSSHSLRAASGAFLPLPPSDPSADSHILPRRVFQGADPVVTHKAAPMKAVPYKADPVPYKADPVTPYKTDPAVPYKADEAVPYKSDPVVDFAVDSATSPYKTDEAVPYKADPVTPYKAVPYKAYKSEPAVPYFVGF